MTNALRGFKGVAVVIVLGVVAASGGFALANHDSNTIHACANNATGALRMVGSATDCRPGETPAQWNVQGPQGDQGPQGPSGPAGVSGYERVTVSSPFNDSSDKHVTVPCPEGKVVVGGGYNLNFGGIADIFVWNNIPSSTAGWTVAARRSDTGIWRLSGYAICVNAT